MSKKKWELLTKCNDGLQDLLSNDIDTLEQLIKAKEIIKTLMALHYNPVVTKDDLKKQDKILEQAEQFIKENK